MEFTYTNIKSSESDVKYVQRATNFKISDHSMTNLEEHIFYRQIFLRSYPLTTEDPNMMKNKKTFHLLYIYIELKKGSLNLAKRCVFRKKFLMLILKLRRNLIKAKC